MKNNMIDYIDNFCENHPAELFNKAGVEQEYIDYLVEWYILQQAQKFIKTGELQSAIMTLMLAQKAGIFDTDFLSDWEPSIKLKASNVIRKAKELGGKYEA